MDGSTFAPRLAGHRRGRLPDYGYAQIISGKEWIFAVALRQQLALMTSDFIPIRWKKEISRMLETDQSSMREQ
jgi:hypothetical protein